MESTNVTLIVVALIGVAGHFIQGRKLKAIHLLVNSQLSEAVQRSTEAVEKLNAALAEIKALKERIG